MLKKINKKLFLIILASVFAGIVLTVITNQGVSATSDNSFCLSCHDVPEFKENFAATPHAQVKCLDCHGAGLIKDKTKGTTKAFKTVTGKLDPNNYPEIKANVADEKCLSCHNLSNISRSETAVTMHKIFEENDFTCTDCHDSEFMHGRLGDYSDR